MSNLTPEQRAQIARENGAKSRGPITEEGKAASSRNAIKTGEHSNQIVDFIQPHFAVISNEDQNGFDALLDDLAAIYQPAHVPAQNIVRDIATARWQVDRYNTCITMCWDHALAHSRNTPNSLPPNQAFIEWNVRAAIDLFGANAVVTRLSREVSRLQRQIAFLERQLLFVHKHFHPQAAPVETNPMQPPQSEQNEQNEPEIVTDEADPEVIAAYRAQFPNHRLVILPAKHAQDNDDTNDYLPPAPRRAA